MITLSRLDHEEIAINCDLIVWIEARPDTIVRMLAGETIRVRESVDEIVRRIIAYRSQVLGHAGLGALMAPEPPRAAATAVGALAKLRESERAALEAPEPAP